MNKVNGVNMNGVDIDDVNEVMERLLEVYNYKLGYISKKDFVHEDGETFDIIPGRVVDMSTEGKKVLKMLLDNYATFDGDSIPGVCIVGTEESWQRLEIEEDMMYLVVDEDALKRAIQDNKEIDF